MSPRWIQISMLVPLVVLALFAPACGDSGDGSEDASGAATAPVKVTETFQPQMPYGEEGALSFASIERDGEIVAQAEGIEPRITDVTPLMTEQLEEGSYRVTSYQRACGPSSCGQEPDLSSLDPPSVQCSADFEVREQEPVDLVVAVQPVRGACAIRVASAGPDEPADPNEPATKCPNGEEPNSVVSDLGTDNPDGEPTQWAAIARFLDFERAPLTVDNFQRVATSKSGTQATFVFNEGGFELVRLFLERFDRGWLVVAHYYCEGQL